MTGVVESNDTIVNMIKQTVLRTYSVEKKLTMYNKDKSNYRSFVLVKISKKDIDAIIQLVEEKNNLKLTSKISSTIDKTSKKVLNQAKD